MTLQVEDLHAWYGKSHVLQGVNLQVARGEIVALLGRNGSGRSTTVKAVMGLVQARGRVSWEGRALSGLAAHLIARQGLAYVPESRDVFPRLTVRENLLLGVQPGRRRAPGDWQEPDVFALFPRLAERCGVEAGVLSGGEQQMLVLGRALMGNPGLLLVDEPTEGLAPQAVDRVAEALQALRARGLGVLLVEQKLAIALDVADRCLLVGHGRIVYGGTPAELRARADLRREWLEI